MNDAVAGVEVPLALDKHWDRHKGSCPYTWHHVAKLYIEYEENFFKGVCTAKGVNGETVLHSACRVMDTGLVKQTLE